MSHDYVPSRNDRPHNYEAERGVLGSILLEPNNSIDKCITKKLTKDSFFDPKHQLLYESLLEMHESNMALDSITIVNWLKDHNDENHKKPLLERVGGKDYLDKLQESTIVAAHIEEYSNIVNQKYLCRCMIDNADKAIQLAQHGEEDAYDLLNQLQESFLELTPGNTQDIEPWKDSVQRAFAEIDATDYKKIVTGVTSGFKDLNKRLGGFHKQDMIILAARPAMGKTSLALNIVEHAALGSGIPQQDPIPVGFFSLEMSREQLVKRMLCSNANVDVQLLRDHGKLNRENNNRLTEAVSRLKKANIYIDDTPGLDVLELRARARRMKKQFNVDFIVIDYLQLLNYSKFARDGRQRETMAISGALKAMAKELNIPVMVISQLSRAAEGRVNNEPKLSDLRDSGAIEQDADLVMLLYRKQYYDENADNESNLDIAKYRHGSTGRINLVFRKEITRFQDALYIDEGKQDHE